MNRNTLLSLVRRHLRESIANDGVAPPLGEVVGKIRSEIATLEPSALIPSEPAILPIEGVAAFIDGDLTDQEAQAVCLAAQRDPSVVAELVAAIRAIEQDTVAAPQLSDQLNQRLIDMGKLLPQEMPAQNSSDQQPSVQIVTKRHDQHTNSRRKSKNTTWKWLAAAAAIAAAVSVTLYLRPTPAGPDESHIVENTSDDPDFDVSPTPSPKPESTSRQGDKIVNAPPIVTPIVPTPSGSDDVPPKTVAIENPHKPLMPVGPPPTRDPIVANPPAFQAASFAGLRWSRVTGILAQKNVVAQSSGSRPAVRWSSLDQQTNSLEGGARTHGLSVRTLALSRAEANLATGGSLVVRQDSSAKLTPSPDASVVLDLQHGGVALLNLPASTVVELKSKTKNYGKLRWSKPDTKVIAEHSADGLVVHIHGEGIALGNQQLQESAFVLKPSQQAEPITTLKRLPTWVTRPVDSVAVPRTVLAQIRDTSDLVPALNQHIGVLSRKGQLSVAEKRLLQVLARWQAGLIEPNLFRLAGNRNATIRLAALQLMVELPEWDPRYKAVWAASGQTAADRPRVARMQRFCQLIRDGGRPNDPQINQLIISLDASGLATRAMADYILRRFAGGGPPFDPTTTNRNQRTQAINGWNRYLNRR